MSNLVSLLESISNLKLEKMYALNRWKEASSHLNACLYMFGAKSDKTREARQFEKMSAHDLEVIERQLQKLLDKYEVKTGSKLDITI